jgi:hypothetical protein
MTSYELKKKTNNAGFVFIILLIFIGIISELMIHMMNLITTEYKISKNFESYYRHIYLSHFALKEARKNILEQKTEAFKNWQKVENPFLKKDETLQYKIRFLQSVPCFHINESEKTGADFFSVDIESGRLSDAQHIQATFVQPSKLSLTCHQVVKKLNAGYLSWRIVAE